MRLYIKVNQSRSNNPCEAIMLRDWGSAAVFSDCSVTDHITEL